MPQPDRRPPVKMESRDERVTVRFTPTEIEILRLHAMGSGDELSRYIRKCSLMGDSLRESIPALKATGV
jgi:hypothetical protein